MSKEISVLKRGKLTKQFLMNLPDNVFLASNIFSKKSVPAFAEKVLPLSKRVLQWKKLVENSVDQRLCYVFKNKNDYEKWLKQTIN